MKIITAAFTLALGVLPALAAGGEQPKEGTKAKTISREAAQKTALDLVKGGALKSAELETEEGKEVWSFGISSGAVIREVWIDAANGLIVQDKTESAAAEKAEAAGDKAEAEAKKPSLPRIIKREAAQKTALESVKGGAVKSAELDNENGKKVWSFEIAVGRERREVKVDAVTGKLLPPETGEENEGKEGPEGAKGEK